MTDETCKKENCEHYSIDDVDGTDICRGFPGDDDPTPTDDEVDRWDRAFHGDCPATECPWYKDLMSENMKCIFMLSHPHRFNIGRLLAKADEKGLYSEQIADELDISRDHVSFYLSKMFMLGLVSHEHALKEPAGDKPMAVLYYKFTKKGRDIFDGIMNIVEEPEKEEPPAEEPEKKPDSWRWEPQDGRGWPPGAPDPRDKDIPYPDEED